MPEVKPLDPNLRQRLSAALTGDAKQGSLRQHLVEGLLGSSVGDDTGLVGYTPLGMVFAADAANRDRRMGGSGAGHTLEAAAGMIPGAGKLEGKALQRVLESEAFADALDAAHEAAGKKAKTEFHNFGWGGTDTGLASKTDQGILETEFNPKTGKFEHSLDGSFLHTSDLPPSLVKGAMAEEAFDASRLPKLDRVGQKHTSDPYMPPEEGFDEFPGQSRYLGGKDVTTANDLGNAKLTVRQQLEAAGGKVVGDDMMRASKEVGALKKNAELDYDHEGNLVDLSKMNFSGAKGSASKDFNRANEILKQHGYRIKGDREWGEYIVTGPGGEVTRTDDLNDAFHTALADKKFQAERGLDPAARGKEPGSLRGEKPGQPYEAPDTGKILLDELSRSDPQKYNFIKNGMEDEGGNSAEDVAATYLQHLSEKDPKAFNALHDKLDPTGADPDLALNHLVDTYSIPELMAMHYDLDPKTMSKAYTMPAARPKGRPTQ